MKPVSSDKRIAFIGLGKMGGGFSRNLIKKGYNLNLFDADPNVLKRFEHTNGKLCLSIEECVNDADYVFTSLPNSKIVRDVYLGEKGILKSLKKKSTLIELSTINPITSAEIEKNTLGRGNGYLAVTIGKGPSQAERGESPLFIGGSEETFSRSKEILLDIGSNLYYFGTVEKCISFKLISNLIGMVNLAALAEGYALALEYGIEPDVFKKALNETGGKSYQQEIRLDMLIQGDFTEKFALQYTVKDLGLANDLAREKNFPLFISPLVFNIYQSVNAKGYGKLDSAAVLKFFERGE